MANGDTKIINEDYISQIKEFSGLHFGSITPTDIDCFFDFGDKIFIFIELKYGNAKLPFGQRLALERLCDACDSERRNSCLIIGRHTAKKGMKIDVASAIVSSVRWKRKWNPWTDKNDTVRELIVKIKQWDGAHNAS